VSLKSECFKKRHDVEKGVSSVGISPQVHFCGTLWDVNACELAKFSRGCLKAEIPFYRHGTNFLPDDFWSSPEIIQKCGNASWEEDDSYISNKRRNSLVEYSMFGMALQGEAHLAGNNSYISDRALFSASLGHLVVTNNPVVRYALHGFEDLYAYSPHIELLCGISSAKAGMVQPQRRAQLIAHIAEEHTYVSRFADIAKMLVLLSLNATATGGSGEPGISNHQNKLAWCAELESTRALTKGLPKHTCTLRACGCGPPYNEPWCANMIDGLPEAVHWCRKYKTQSSCNLFCGEKTGDSLWCPHSEAE
jgi:hypothetical protein